MNLLSTDEAAALKGTSRQVIIRAIKRGEIDTVPVGKRFVVKANKRFEEWQLSERHQKAGKTRWRAQ
ncbi:MAG: hypothetical protein QF579_04620 [Dehalococcoidia bacterium]|nr:hypothetical protein [Dehalococcoidia bacterium]